MIPSWTTPAKTCESVGIFTVRTPNERKQRMYGNVQAGRLPFSTHHLAVCALHLSLAGSVKHRRRPRHHHSRVRRQLLTSDDVAKVRLHLLQLHATTALLGHRGAATGEAKGPCSPCSRRLSGFLRGKTGFVGTYGLRL